MQEIIKDRFSEGSVEFYHFFRDWLIQHILERDKNTGHIFSKPLRPKALRRELKKRCKTRLAVNNL